MLVTDELEKLYVRNPKLADLQKQRNKAEYKVRDWRAKADEVFTFACYAKEDFNSDDLEKKLGVIVKLLDRTIQFTPDKYFIPLEQMNERQKLVPENG